MTWKRLFLGLVFATHASAFSLAGERIAVGVKAGTLGVGADLTLRLSNFLGVRGSVNTLDVSASYEDTDVDYDGDFRLGARGVLLDFHPFRGNFRLTGGVMRNRNSLDLEATPTENVEIGGTTYTPAEIGTLTGRVRFKRESPYFGIGFGSAARGPGRLRFLLDAGVLRQGSGDVTIRASRPGVLPADLRREEAEIEDDIADYDYWPVVALGISIRLF